MLSRRRFDVDEYHRMMQAGILVEGDRVELLDGEIVEMAAIGSRHVSCVARIHRALLAALGDRAFVSSQGVVRLDRYSEPQPDVIVLRPRPDDYASEHPGPDDTLLVVEVADTSLAYDRGFKLERYARAGVPEAWVVDLTSAAIECHRRPEADGYAHRDRFTTGTIRPDAFPDLELDVAALLPPAG